MGPVRVIVVDDHPIVRDGLLSSLQTIPGILLIAACSNGEEALEKLSLEAVDVLLADMCMSPLSGRPDGSEICATRGL